MWMKLALREVNPFMLVFFRVFFAGIGLSAYFLITRRKLNLRWWWVYLFIGFFNIAFPFVLISWAETHISSGLAAILNSTVPLFTMIIAAFFYREDKFTLQHGIALITCFLGVFVLSYTKLEGNSDFQFLGILAMLVAASSYSASTVFARRVDKYVSPEDHSMGQILAALVFITPMMFITNSPVILPKNPTTWLALACLGLIVSFVAALVWFRMIYEIGPSRASTMIYMFPLVGVILGITFLGEKVSWQVVVGGIFILAGIYIVNSKRISQLVNLGLPRGTDGVEKV
jgi:drug/metabolite transporter (DMT)-like permease